MHIQHKVFYIEITRARITDKYILIIMGLSSLFSKAVLLVFMVEFMSQVCSQSSVFDVKDSGAVGDGKTDNTNVSFNDIHFTY